MQSNPAFASRLITLTTSLSRIKRKHLLQWGSSDKRSVTVSTSVRPIVSTYREVLVPTETQPLRVPLSVVDIHLRHEELPFAYFFQGTLGEQELEASLRLVLRDFPQMGGRICSDYTSIQCATDDTVRLTFGRIEMTMKEWSSQPRGHLHHSFSSSATRENGGRPELMPIFDSLFLKSDTGDFDSRLPPAHLPLAKIRVTYFEDDWTAIGVNVLHLVGDTATCIHFVQSWGKQMRRKPYQRWGTDRSRACISGMMTEDLADLIGIHRTASVDLSSMYTTPLALRSYLPAILSSTPLFAELFKKFHPMPSEDSMAPSIRHEYVRLVFTKELLIRLKEIGNSSCQGSSNQGFPSFVSTNDMLTSYGWLLKCHLSQNNDRGLSMVYNLRGRSDVNSEFFGNGISHVTASEQFGLQSELCSAVDEGVAQSELLTRNLCDGAKSIRRALTLGLTGLPDALAASRIGRPQPASANSKPSFSTTNWGQFPLYKIRFAEHALFDFHGHPAHPLPPGRTYASVIAPSSNNSVCYEMFLPSDQAEEAQKCHRDMSSICMEWMDPQEEKTRG